MEESHNELIVWFTVSVRSVELSKKNEINPSFTVSLSIAIVITIICDEGLVKVEKSS